MKMFDQDVVKLIVVILWAAPSGDSIIWNRSWTRPEFLKTNTYGEDAFSLVNLVKHNIPYSSSNELHRRASVVLAHSSVPTYKCL